MTISYSLAQSDVATVLRASQALSGEMHLDGLIETLMRIVMEHAAAERALLILLHEGQTRIEAEANVGGSVPRVTLRPEIIAAEYSGSVVQCVIRTRESVLLDDVTVSNPHSEDEYLQRKRPRSVLCLPILKQATLIGLLYLEHHLTPHAFTPGRVVVLELLASQAAISLENARLYAELQQENLERKRVEDELRRSEQLMSEAQRIGQTGSWSWNIKTGKLVWSEEQRRIFGVPAERNELTYDDFTGMIHPDDRSGAMATIDDAARLGREFNQRFRIVLPDGAVKFIHGSANPVSTESGVLLEYVGAVRDVTDQVKVETALEEALARVRESEGQLRTTIDTIPGLVWTTLPEGAGEFFSQRWLDYTGLSTEEAKGDGWAVALHPDDKGMLFEVWVKMIATKMPGEVEARLRRFDGEYRWFLFRGAPFIDQMGNVVKWYGTNTDIDDLKQAEAGLRRREADLRKAQAELAHVTRVTTMVELAASIAHEVNQPIAGVVLNGNACMRWLSRLHGDPDALAEVRDALQRIIRDGARAGEVITRIRALFKKTETAKASLKINEVIREVIVLARSEMDKRRVILRLELDNDIPPVPGDRVQLQQVVINLILNGIEAMGAVEDRPREMIIRTQLYEGGQVLVTVRDSGIGLDQERNEQLFAAFHTTKPGGLGMGLPISRSIVENHNGRLWATANEDAGATFQFTLTTRSLQGRPDADP
ncbi:MAG: PAS domain-containing protein [Chthoniobacteraceae bacterium]